MGGERTEKREEHINLSLFLLLYKLPFALLKPKISGTEAAGGRRRGRLWLLRRG